LEHLVRFRASLTVGKMQARIEHGKFFTRLKRTEIGLEGIEGGERIAVQDSPAAESHRVEFGHHAEEPADERPGNMGGPPLSQHSVVVTRIAGEDFVAAVAGERHGNVFAGDLGDVISGYGGAVGKRLVEVV